MTCIDFHKAINGFHSDEVTLPNLEQTKMRERRDAGRTRLRNGLVKNQHPLPKAQISQGSYAMRTMVQDDESDYDIDDGVYFDKEDLKLSEQEYLSPRQAKLRVKNALKDQRLQFDAQIKNNCVRQNYPEGYHIDIPVYRIVQKQRLFGEPETHFELASGESWITSDAQAVSKWFNDKVSELKSGEADKSQLRKITKLTKKFARRQKNWKKNTTSGICITKLVVDNFVPHDLRDDLSLLETWERIFKSLTHNLSVEHPLKPGEYFAGHNDVGLIFFRDCLAGALNELIVLNEPEISSDDACKVWNRVFNTHYFTNNKPKTSNSLLQPAASISTGLTFPNEPVIPNKSAGFA